MDGALWCFAVALSVYSSTRIEHTSHADRAQTSQDSEESEDPAPPEVWGQMSYSQYHGWWGHVDSK